MYLTSRHKQRSVVPAHNIGVLTIHLLVHDTAGITALLRSQLLRILQSDLAELGLYLPSSWDYTDCYRDQLISATCRHEHYSIRQCSNCMPCCQLSIVVAH